MYSTPIFTIHQSLILLDNLKFSSLPNLRNLHLENNINPLPQHEIHAPYDMAGWKQICRSLASMKSLRNLRITLTQDRFFFETRSQDENAKLVTGLLEPLETVKMAEGGQFDIVTVDWTARLLLGDMPFQLTTERKSPFLRKKIHPVPDWGRYCDHGEAYANATVLRDQSQYLQRGS